MIINNSLKLIIFLQFVINTFFVTASEGLLFKTNGIKTIYEMLPLNIRTALSEIETEHSSFYLIDAGKVIESKNIIFRFNQYNELSHIGLHLFENEVMNTNTQLVFDYLERVLLTYCLAYSNTAAIQKMRSDNVTMIINNETLEGVPSRPIRSFFTFGTDTPFNLNREDDFFKARWSINLMNHAEFKFPNDFIAISGMDKSELEYELAREFQNIKKGQHVVVDLPKSDLQHYNQDIFVLKGKIYKDVVEINSNYYLFSNETTSPVFDENNFYESASNMFLNLIPTNIKLQICHKLYGDELGSYLVNINDFFSHFEYDYTLYFGWQNKDGYDLSASIFIYNSFFDYSHLLMVKFNKEDIFNEQRILQADLFSFTPHNNLKKN